MSSLGRTGLETGVVGLGCGGASRLGQAQGATTQESVRVVQRALELGITYLDTAEVYGTEEIVGKGIAGHCDEVIVSTKVVVQRLGKRRLNAARLRAAVGRSLKQLAVEKIDVYHLHGVTDPQYDYCVAELVPELERLRDEGLIRFLAISELFAEDAGHVMLQRAVADDCWEVMMVGFNILNPSARRRVLPTTMAKGIGVEVMFAVRRALSDPAELRSIARKLIAEQRISSDDLDAKDPLGFLVHDGAARTVVDAAYRFARREPGCNLVLTGTGNLEHLEQNVRSINSGPLPSEDLDRLAKLFGSLDHLTGA